VQPYYTDEAVTIYHGDCREVLPTLGMVDHVITDPPYARDVYLRARNPDSGDGKGTDGRTHALRVGASLARMAAGDIGSIDEALAPVALEIGRIVRRWALVFSDAETTHRWKAELEAAGLRYVRTGAWVKPDAMPQMSGDRPSVGFEPATICHAKGPMRWNGGGHAAVWTHGTCKVNRPNHPCPKPEPLMIELVSLFTDEGETILDPFMGSGTTLLAAKRLGRRAVGIEVSEAFCEEAVRRLRQSVLALEYAPAATQADLWPAGDGDAA
jgi:DNA modification methylase